MMFPGAFVVAAPVFNRANVYRSPGDATESGWLCSFMRPAIGLVVAKHRHWVYVVTSMGQAGWVNGYDLDVLSIPPCPMKGQAQRKARSR